MQDLHSIMQVRASDHISVYLTCNASRQKLGLHKEHSTKNSMENGPSSTFVYAWNRSFFRCWIDARNWMSWKPHNLIHSLSICSSFIRWSSEIYKKNKASAKAAEKREKYLLNLHFRNWILLILICVYNNNYNQKWQLFEILFQRKSLSKELFFSIDEFLFVINK